MFITPSYSFVAQFQHLMVENAILGKDRDEYMGELQDRMSNLLDTMYDDELDTVSRDIAEFEHYVLNKRLEQISLGEQKPAKEDGPPVWLQLSEREWIFTKNRDLAINFDGPCVFTEHEDPVRGLEEHVGGKVKCGDEAWTAARAVLWNKQCISTRYQSEVHKKLIKAKNKTVLFSNADMKPADFYCPAGIGISKAVATSEERELHELERCFLSWPSLNGATKHPVDRSILQLPAWQKIKDSVPWVKYTISKPKKE